MGAIGEAIPADLHVGATAVLIVALVGILRVSRDTRRIQVRGLTAEIERLRRQAREDKADCDAELVAVRAQADEDRRRCREDMDEARAEQERLASLVRSLQADVARLLEQAH